MNKLKGVSPVVAEVLLMGIAVSAAVSAGVFLQGTISDIQDGAEDQISQEDREESTSIGVDFGYNGTNGYLLMDVRNTGSYTIAVEEEDQKNWNMYIDNIPVEWNYTDGSDYLNQREVPLDPSSTITLNTTQKFPVTGESKEVEISGPYNLRTSFICFSENDGCET